MCPAIAIIFVIFFYYNNNWDLANRAANAITFNVDKFGIKEIYAKVWRRRIVHEYAKSNW
jgi:hypothetical protein